MRRLPLAAAAAVVFALGCSGGDIDRTGLVKVAGNVYAWVAEGPEAENGLGANAGFVVGTDAVLVIDTRYTPELAGKLKEAISSVTDVPVRYVVNTHYHPDHTWGNSEFAGPGVTIISTPSARADIEKYTPVYLDYYREQRPRDYKLLANVRMALPDSTFEDTLEIDLGGIKAVVYHLGPAHTAGDAFVSVPSTRTLFAGGLVSNGYHANMSDQGADYGNWLATLEKLSTTGIDRVVPGQGKVTGMSALDRQHEYIENVIEAGREAIAGRVSLSDAAEKTVIPGTEGYLQANILPFNLQSVYKRYTLEIVSPGFDIELPPEFEVREGQGDGDSGRLMWTAQAQTGYSEFEVEWGPTHRAEIIVQDLHEMVGRFVGSNQDREMEVGSETSVIVMGEEALALRGRWGYARSSGRTGSGQWFWTAFLADGRIWSVRMSTNAGKDKDLEDRNIAVMKAALSTFRLK